MNSGKLQIGLHMNTEEWIVNIDNNFLLTSSHQLSQKITETFILVHHNPLTYRRK